MNDDKKKAYVVMIGDTPVAVRYSLEEAGSAMAQYAVNALRGHWRPSLSLREVEDAI